MKHSNRLRVMRAERRITQLDLADAAHLSITKVWRIENGYHQPTADERRALAKALRTTIGDLFPAPDDAPKVGAR